MSLLLSVCACMAFGTIDAQTTVEGTVRDNQTKETLIGAAVVIEGTTIGSTTDFDGKFSFKTNETPPFRLSISFLGYKTKTLSVSAGNTQNLSISLESDAVLMEAVEVKAQRISQKQQQAALTVESMDVLAIKEAASGNFYESLGNLKEVDITSASLGFKVVNTRGFNSTSPVRSLQLIDGVDNQSPGLNFSLGNFLGASDLDLRNVEIVAGASSAFFGPGAFNGVVNMTTKDPYDFPGVSAEIKVGERALFQNAVRIADFTTDDEGNKRFGYKVNFFRMEADDWEAEDYRPIEGAVNDETHPFGFDAVNIYGDEDVSFNNDNSDNLFVRPGLTDFNRNGYREIDLLDYSTDNTKVGLGLFYRTKEELQFDYGFNYSTGSTIYQGQNRYAMRDIQFYQHRLQVGKKDKWFLRAYRTSEDAGRTYDVVTTAIRMQEAQGSQADWNTRYLTTWSNQILNEYPEISAASDSIFGVVQQQIADGVIQSSEAFDVFNDLSIEWIDDNFELLNEAHLLNVDIVNSLSGDDLEPFFEPGTQRFDSLFQDVTSRIFTDDGSRFFDRSSLNHVHGEYKFRLGTVDMTVGANARWYMPNSRGTIFADTLGYTYERDEQGNFVLENGQRVKLDSARVEITNSEWGAYVGAKKKFSEDRFTANATLRVDKNENFDYLFSPALSLVYTPSETTTWRASLSSAIRNPTLADQYLYYNVGRAILLGNVDGAFEQGVDSLFTIDSFDAYRNGLNRDTLDWFNVESIRPEQVQTLELGYRGRATEDLYIDLGGYYSRYTDFIGVIQGVTADFNPLLPNAPPTNLQAYQIAANAASTVTTRGVSLGFNYFFKKMALSGNYSFNELVSGDDDPIIPAFNTPRHKFNLGLSGREMRLFKRIDHFGFGINYKWIEGFLFEGSPQFTGSIPSYDMVDAQVNLFIPELSSTIKIGGSNIMGIRPFFAEGVENRSQRAFDNRNYQVYGGPLVGRLLYASLLIELK